MIHREINRDRIEISYFQTTNYNVKAAFFTSCVQQFVGKPSGAKANAEAFHLTVAKPDAAYFSAAVCLED